MADSIVEQFTWLKNVDIYNTTACNGNCSDCMAYDLREEEGVRHMDKQLFFGVMDQLEGVDSVHFAGVEPFMHPDIFEMMDYASERVAKEVRINTNGFMIPTNYEIEECGKEKEAKEFFEKLPKNTHIYLSVDKYHEECDKDEEGDDKLFGRVVTLLEYAEKYGLGATFNVRVLDKEDEFKELAERYPGLIRNSIVNRVLKMGKAKGFEHARYVDIHKLLDDHVNNPMIGILHDGTVVSNFIAAYLPKSNRPRVCELGDIKEESLTEILERYQLQRRRYFRYGGWYNAEPLLCSIDDMKSYPFVIENPNDFNWEEENLKDKKEEIIENTLNLIVESIENFHRPLLPHGTSTRLISIDGKLRHDVELWSDEKWVEAKKKTYYDIFVQNAEIENKELVDEDVVKDRMLKFYLLSDILCPDMPGHTIQDDERFWFWGRNEFEKIRFTEDEWKNYLSDMVRRGIVERLFFRSEIIVVATS